jgi:hypothetical protein
MTTHTLDSTASREPNRPAVLRAAHAFRHWRKGRPFPAGLLIVLAGVELWLAPLSSIGNIIHEGVGGVSAFFIGALMIMFGLTVWFAPAYRVFAGIASILLGLIALPATNLGGFVIGTLLALIGGGLAVAWTPRPGWEAPTRRARRRLHDGEPAETAAFAEPETADGGTGDTAVLLSQASAGPSPEELAALEARAREDVSPTTDFPEVEETGADQHPEN